MAASRNSQLLDQWRPEDPHRESSRREAAFAQSRQRSPAPAKRVREPEVAKLDSGRNHTSKDSHNSRALPPTRDRSRLRDTVRRRSPSLPPRDDNLYRPTRKRELARERSASRTRQRRPSSPAHKSRRLSSRSPHRDSHRTARAPRSRSRESLKAARPVRRETERAYSPRPSRDVYHDDRYSPRRRSPDTYIPTTRRRSRSPVASSYRPAETRRRARSPSPRQRVISRRELSPRDLLSREHHTRKRTPSPEVTRSHHNGRQVAKREEESYKKRSSQQVRRSPSPRGRRILSPVSRKPRTTKDDRAYSRSPRRGRERETVDRRANDGREDMSWNGYGRGGPPRPGYLPHDPYAQSPPPYYPPQHMSPPPQQHSPYGSGPGWPQPGYPPSQQGSPYGYPPAPSPYQANGYPPAPSPGYYGAPPPQMPYAASPPHPQYPYAVPPHPQQQQQPQQPHGHRGNLHSPSSDRRSFSQSSREGGSERKGRGHYSNLSWTPQTGSRGGVQVPPRNRAGEKEKGKSVEAEEDDPFRPAKDLRAEDDAAKEEAHAVKETSAAQATPPIDEPQAENKIKFALKAKPAPPPSAMPTGDLSAKMRDPPVSLRNAHLPQTSAKITSRSLTLDNRRPAAKVAAKPAAKPDYRKPAERAREEEKPRTEKKLIKRLRPRPTLPPELASSDSVYFRKPGNESVVGSGTYGKVFRAIHVYTGNKVALKKIRMEGERDGFPVTAIREVKLLQSLNHDNVVKLQEVMVEKNDCYMVFEYLSHDLTGLLNHPTFKLEHSNKKHLAKQLFEGLDYLHRRGVLHRDIKAANILISNTGQLKLADFGLARFYVKSQTRPIDYTNRVITIWYRSPELLLGATQYGPSVDIWSAACVLVEIFTKHAIFPGNGGEINQLDRIYNVLGTPTRTEWPDITELAWYPLLAPAERKPSTFEEKYRERVTPAAFSLLKNMFAFDPQLRPSAAEVLDHAYFKEEEPMPRQVFELKDLEGDWHEFESKALRKEKERGDRDREQKRAAAATREEADARMEKRRAEGEGDGARDSKKVRVGAEGFVGP